MTDSSGKNSGTACTKTEMLPQLRVPLGTLARTEFIAQQNTVSPQASPVEPLIVVSFADKDRKSAEELLDCLETGLKARKDAQAKQIRFWKYTDDLRAGDNDDPTIQDAFRRAQKGLLFLSPSAAASQYIKAKEWPHFRDESGNVLKPFVPVLLNPVDPGKHDLGVLGKIEPNGRSQLFHLRHERKNLTWNECKEIEARKDAFVENLIDEILDIKQTPSPDSLIKKAKRMLEHRREAVMDRYVENSADDVALQGASRKSAFKGEIIPKLKDWACDRSDTPFAVLLGEYGMGKTWSSQLLALTLVESINNKEPNIPTPIYLDLRVAVKEKSKLLGGDVPALEDLLESLGRNNTPPGETPLTAEEIFRAVRKEGALLIFDGLDEVLAHKRDDAWGQAFINSLFDVLPFDYWPRHLNSNTQSPCPGKLLLTCRTHYFKSVQTQNDQILGLGREQHEAARPRAWQLLPFSKEQVLKYLELHIPEQDPQTVYELIASVHDLSEIASRPQGIKMVCAQINEIEAAKLEGKTVNGATIYAWMVNKWLSRDHGKHQLHEDDKRELMGDLALHMWQLGVRQMPWNDLSKWFKDMLQLGMDQEKAESYLTDLRNATFLVRPGEDNFTFAHTSIQEYFLAVRLYRSLEEDDAKTWENLNPSRETLNFLLQHHQTCPPYRQKKVRETLTKYLEQAEAGEAARESWLELFLLAPKEWPLKTLNISGLSLEGYAFSDLTLNTLIADDAYLAKTQWSHCHFGHSSWRHTICRKMQCDRLTGDQADFSYANLFDGRWRHVRIEETIFDEALHLDTLQRFPTAVGQSPSRNWRLLWRKNTTRKIISACSVSADGQRFITASSDGTARVWDEKGQCLLTLKGHEGWVTACSMSEDGRRFITGSTDGMARVWDEKGQCLFTLKGYELELPVAACSMSADGRRFITASDGRTVQVWDEKGQCLLTLKGHEGWVISCSMSADGRRFITAGDDGTTRVWDEKGQCLLTLEGHEDWVSSCSMSADGRRFITASKDRTARVWDEKGQYLLTLEGHKNVVRSCSMSADGRRFITASDDHTARVWNEQGQCLHILKGHSRTVLACSMSADGRRIITGSSNAILLWVSDDLTTWKCALELHPYTQTVIWLDAKTQTLKLKGPDWPFWQLTHPDDKTQNMLGEAIAAFGPMAHEQLANADEWDFLPRDDIQADED